MEKDLILDLVSRMMKEEVEHKLVNMRKTSLTAGELILELSKVSPDSIVHIDRQRPSEPGYEWWGCQVDYVDDLHCVLGITRYEGS